MPGMGLAGGYGAGGVAQALDDLVKQRLLQQQLDEQVRAAQAMEQFRQQQLAQQQQQFGVTSGQEGQRIDISRQDLETQLPGRAADAPYKGALTDQAIAQADRMRVLTQQEQAAEAEKQASRGRLRQTPEGALMLDRMTATEAKASPVDVFDPTGKVQYGRRLGEIGAETEGAIRVADARAVSAKPEIREVMRNGVVGKEYRYPDGRVEFEPKGMTTGQRESAALFGNVFERAKDLDKYYDRDLLGPGVGRAIEGSVKFGSVQPLGEMMGWTPEQRSKAIHMSTLLAQMKNTIIYARTGKQINIQELDRMDAELPSMSNDPELFDIKLAQTKANLVILRRMMERAGLIDPEGNPTQAGAQGAQPTLGSAPETASPYLSTSPDWGKKPGG